MNRFERTHPRFRRRLLPTWRKEALSLLAAASILASSAPALAQNGGPAASGTNTITGSSVGLPGTGIDPGTTFSGPQPSPGVDQQAGIQGTETGAINQPTGAINQPTGTSNTMGGLPSTSSTDNGTVNGTTPPGFGGGPGTAGTGGTPLGTDCVGSECTAGGTGNTGDAGTGFSGTGTEADQQAGSTDNR